jgi:hypothetical protein
LLLLLLFLIVFDGSSDHHHGDGDWVQWELRRSRDAGFSRKIRRGDLQQ